ncbi:hypothetical protein F4777DRAFT_176799 [Nemania sp. FL0916]|nr:hypothetical protein F4777DRAFT_176799 [Nemania sp. FL0916]
MTIASAAAFGLPLWTIVARELFCTRQTQRLSYRLHRRRNFSYNLPCHWESHMFLVSHHFILPDQRAGPTRSVKEGYLFRLVTLTRLTSLSNYAHGSLNEILRFKFEAINYTSYTATDSRRRVLL